MSPENDPRSVSELIETALATEAEGAWEEVAALHWRGTREVLDAAVALCGSDAALDRAIGAEILGQLGIPERAFPEECFATLTSLLGDPEIRVVCSAIYALGHLGLGRSAKLIPFSKHPDAHVRHAVTFALAGIEDDEVIATLLALMSDPDADVRDWATFAIGSQSDVDSPAIRTALLAGLGDEDADVRFEAICGLGRRRDLRALPYLQVLLQNDPEDFCARIVTQKLLDLPDGDEPPTAELLIGLKRLSEGKSK